MAHLIASDECGACWEYLEMSYAFELNLRVGVLLSGRSGRYYNNKAYSMKGNLLEYVGLRNQVKHTKHENKMCYEMNLIHINLEICIIFPLQNFVFLYFYKEQQLKKEYRI